MSTSNFIRLLLLAAIWGTSFMLMRIAAPVFGPMLTTFGRAALGTLALYLYAKTRSTEFAWRRHAVPYLIIGLLNTAIPFSLFAWAALYIPSAYMATMNSLAPVFTGLFGFLLLKERLNAVRVASFVLGMLGVAVLVGVGPTTVTPQVIAGVLACLGSAVCYGYGAIYTRMNASGIPSLAIATGSQFAATLVLLPFALPALPHALQAATFTALTSVAILGVACTGIAYALYFHLIASEGASKAIVVTLLVPVTASLWAWPFLHEPITAGTTAGISIVLCATAMALGLFGKWKNALLKKSAK